MLKYCVVHLRKERRNVKHFFYNNTEVFSASNMEIAYWKSVPPNTRVMFDSSLDWMHGVGKGLGSNPNFCTRTN